MIRLRIDDFASTSLAGLLWMANWADVNENVAGVDFDGDGLSSSDRIDWVFLMREGDASDIKLE